MDAGSAQSAVFTVHMLPDIIFQSITAFSSCRNMHAKIGIYVQAFGVKNNFLA